MYLDNKPLVGPIGIATIAEDAVLMKFMSCLLFLYSFPQWHKGFGGLLRIGFTANNI